MFGGWPGFYKFFFEKYRFSLEEVNALPIYLACLLLGAIGPDHTDVKMTFGDTLRYYGQDPEKMRLLRLALSKTASPLNQKPEPKMRPPRRRKPPLPPPRK